MSKKLKMSVKLESAWQKGESQVDPSEVCPCPFQALLKHGADADDGGDKVNAHCILCFLFQVLVWCQLLCAVSLSLSLCLFLFS